MDRRTRLILEVEGLIINRVSSRLCAEEVVNLVEATMKGEREPVENPKPWSPKYGIQQQSMSTIPEHEALLGPHLKKKD